MIPVLEKLDEILEFVQDDDYLKHAYKMYLKCRDGYIEIDSKELVIYGYHIEGKFVLDEFTFKDIDEDDLTQDIFIKYIESCNFNPAKDFKIILKSKHAYHEIEQSNNSDDPFQVTIKGFKQSNKSKPAAIFYDDVTFITNSVHEFQDDFNNEI